MLGQVRVWLDKKECCSFAALHTAEHSDLSNQIRSDQISAWCVLKICEMLNLKTITPFIDGAEMDTDMVMRCT